MSDRDEGVTWAAMIHYVDQRDAVIASRLEGIAGAITKHEVWHRDYLAHQIENARSSRWQSALVVITAMAAIASTVIGLVAIAHG